MNHAMTMNQFGLIPMTDTEMNETEGGVLPLLLLAGGVLLLSGCSNISWEANGSINMGGVKASGSISGGSK